MACLRHPLSWVGMERATGRILEVSCTTLPPYGNEFIRELLLGKRIDEDLKTITEEIRSRYICRTSDALLAALQDLVKRLREDKMRTPGKVEEASNPGNSRRLRKGRRIS